MKKRRTAENQCVKPRIKECGPVQIFKKFNDKGYLLHQGN